MIPIKKTKSEMVAALATNLPQLPVCNEIINETTIAAAIVSETEEDYHYARDHIKKLISTSDEAIGSLHSLAADSEHPRAFEVLSTLIKTAADMNGQLLSLQRERKKIVCAEQTKATAATAVNSTTTNNSIFVGTTAELQKLIKAQGMPVIDIP